MFENLLNVSSEVEEILHRRIEGKRLSAKDACRLMNSQNDEVLAEGIVANSVRKNVIGNTVTYVVNRNINFTNVCIGTCKFCAFRRAKNAGDAYLLSKEEVRKKSIEAKKAGATELCIQGGLHPDLGIPYYGELLKVVKETSGLHVHAFSPMEIKYAAEKSGLSIDKSLEYLKECGLDSIPGTAAEILDDDVRSAICPNKIKTKEWIEVIKAAHKHRIPTTATMLYGHVEGVDKQVKHLEILRKIQDETKGFTEFIPLSFVHFNSPLYRSGNSKGGATGIEDLKVYAVSRLFLNNFRNIQASWIKLGRKLAQVMLDFGANDLGGTLMEENISKSAGVNSEMMTVREFERMILESGRTPKQRDTLYNLL